MFKKSIIICSCLACLSVIADAKFELKSAKQSQTAFVAPKYAFKNPSSHQLAVESMDNLQKEIKIYVDNKQVTNAQQMYDLVTKIRASEHNSYTLLLLDVMRSFLRRQDNHMKLEQLISKTSKLIAALEWLNTAKKQDNNTSFYDKTEYIATLMDSEYFIHLNKEQMLFCIKFTEKMKAAMNINVINDDANAEDGVALTSDFLEKELTNAREIVADIDDLEKQLKQIGTNIANASKENLTAKIEQLSNILNQLKRMEITVDKKKILLSKNMVRHLRGIGGAIMSQLQARLNKLQ
ncbi:MAG: hypothetical protein K6C34_03710 [Alphaproteobacteria bacterium]|nr:hypothetical protein [Alphaproteobacteria bacterium]